MTRKSGGETEVEADGDDVAPAKIERSKAADTLQKSRSMLYRLSMLIFQKTWAEVKP